jgi:hypothetical protein
MELQAMEGKGTGKRPEKGGRGKETDRGKGAPLATKVEHGSKKKRGGIGKERGP